MTLPALDLALSSASPLPEGAIAPPSGDGTAEPAPAPDAATAKSPSGEAAPTRSPAASLVSIALKGKSAGATKAGDLTRLFELARRPVTPPAAPSEVLAEPAPAPAPELESVPQFVLTAPGSFETPAAEAPSEAPLLEAVLAPVPTEAALPVEPAASETVFEPSSPLMLPPPAAVPIESSAVPPLAEPDPAPPEEPAFIDVPDWLRAAATDESALAPQTPAPLSVALVPTEETAASAEILDPPRVDEQPAAAIASTAVAEPPPVVAVTTEAPPIAVALVEPPLIAVALVEPPRVPEPVAPPAPVFKELVDYWRSLRSGDDHPAAEALDRDLVTERWPGTLLIAYTPASQDPRGELRPGRVTRLGTACAETQSVVDAGSHSTEWMLKVARTALINDEPLEEQQRQATIKGVAGFRMVALPLGPRKGLANAVLCTLAPSANAPRFGKRRTWL